jgi:cardiolipin synthase A/B
MRERRATHQQDHEGNTGLDRAAWYTHSKPVFTGGNQVTLLRGGRALFPAMIDQIEAARHSVWLALYMVTSRGQSALVLQALMQAAQRGVSVHLVADAFGSHDAPQSLWAELEAAGVKVARYRPLHRFWGLLDSAGWRRMHIKLCVIDDTEGFVGGINLIDDFFDLHHGWSGAPRLDYAVHVKGPALIPMQHTVKAVWTRAKLGRDWRDDVGQWLSDKHRVRRLRVWLQQARLRLTRREEDRFARGAQSREAMRCAFVMRDNLLQRRTIEQAALQAIQQARHRIDIVTPYFYPRRAIRKALRAAAMRGVKVRLLLQGKVDYQLAAMAARVLYGELRRDGVQIYEYQPAFLHAKVLCVDDEWATVGSSNLDPLSLVLNMEANLIVKDRAFVRALSAELTIDFGKSREVLGSAQDASDWRLRLKRGFIRWLAKTYLRLAGVSGRY